jgi:D-3-phosphoglycerate dehydrogenase
MTKPLKECRLLVTPTSYGKNDPDLCTYLEGEVGEVQYNRTGRSLKSQELVEKIPGVDGYIAGLDEITREVIFAADDLKVIARYGVGVDAVDLQAAKEKGIVVTNTPGANSASVAELTVGLIISMARNIPSAVEATKSGAWPRLRGISLEGKVVGLLGFGLIGQNVAKRLMGFECKVVAYDPIADEAQAANLDVEVLQRDDLVSQADFLSLHCPLLAETRGMVDGAFLNHMKDGAYLINTARGELVNENSLYQALQTGKLSGVALDVFARQPPDQDNPLISHPLVIATPHMGAHSDGATNAMGWGALTDCLAVLRGDQPKHRLV